MKIIKHKALDYRREVVPTSKALRNEDGAIDLASIMVGIIVIGLIGGVIAAMVFAIIPWSQDNAAKQQLDSLTSAESAYMGLSSAVPMALPAGSAANAFGNSTQLQAANLMNPGATFCVSTSTDGKSYVSYSQSASGNVYTATDKNSHPVLTGTVPDACVSILGSVAHSNAVPAGYVDPTPTRTVMTYNCNVATTGSIPFNTNVTGTETWNDGVTNTYNGSSRTIARNLAAGVTYTMTFDGTYDNLNGYYNVNDQSSSIDPSTSNLTQCLISVDHWGLSSNVKSAQMAFYDATKMTSIPANIPSTITDASYMLSSDTIFNDPNVSKWDTSNITNMLGMFQGDNNFNQSLNGWNTSKVTNMVSMFQFDYVYNQSMSNWDTSQVTNMSNMFYQNHAFNQTVANFNTSQVTSMDSMFFQDENFNQPVNNWDTSKVTSFSQMFSSDYKFNQPLDKWNTSNVTTIMDMFRMAGSFNQPLNTWNTSKVTDMNEVFTDAAKFSYPLNNWDVSHVTRMNSMFIGATAFNQNLSGWNTAVLTPSNGAYFASSPFPVAYLPPNTSLA